VHLCGTEMESMGFRLGESSDGYWNCFVPIIHQQYVQ